MPTANAAAPVVAWNKTYGGPDLDIGGSLVQTSDGGYALAGITFSEGNSSFCLVKTDARGKEQWNRTYAGSGCSGAQAVIQARDGGYVLVGGTQSTGLYDLYIVKTDYRGNLQWTRTCGGADNEIGTSVQQTLDGGYIILGYSYVDINSNDIYMVKLDAQGNVRWTKTYVKQGNEMGNSVQQARDGSYLVVGVTGTYVDSDYGVYALKTDSRGNQMWVATYPLPGTCSSAIARPTKDGGYIVTGGTSAFSNSASDLYLTKLNSHGAVQWSRTFGGPDFDAGFSMQQARDGGYIVTGLCNQNNTDSNSAGDLYMVRTDSNGNLLWEKSVGGSRYDCGFSVIQARDGGFVAAGYSCSFADQIYGDFYAVKVTET